MNAVDALKLSRQYWAENEDFYMKHVIGYQFKVETAANEGRVTCTVAVLPSGNQSLLDFTASFFEEQGYFVLFQGSQTGEVIVGVNWKQYPLGSRPYSDAQEFHRAIK